MSVWYIFYTGIEAATSEKGILLFHSGIAAAPSGLVTNGGRVLITVVLAKQLIVAAAKAELVCSRITFPGSQHRKDIAHKGIARYYTYVLFLIQLHFHLLIGIDFSVPHFHLY